jgi:hypothetical protein
VIQNPKARKPKTERNPKTELRKPNSGETSIRFSDFAFFGFSSAVQKRQTVSNHVSIQSGRAATEVAQVSNLLYRGFPTRNSSAVRGVPPFGIAADWEIGDTAGLESSIRGFSRAELTHRHCRRAQSWRNFPGSKQFLKAEKFRNLLVPRRLFQHPIHGITEAWYFPWVRNDAPITQEKGIRLWY